LADDEPTRDAATGPATDSAPARLRADIRFSLANERTLLSYQRTAIGLMGAAIAVAHFFGDGPLVVLFALALLLTGVVAAVGGYLHFRQADRAIQEGVALSNGPAAHVLSIAMLVCLAIAAAYILTR
jgi:putative membrane protein